MSPALPPSSSSPPNVSMYPFITQDRLVGVKFRLVMMCGSAMFTTVASRMIMSWAPSMMARATPARLAGLASSARAVTGTQRRQDASTAIWIRPHFAVRGSLRIFPRPLAADRPLAGRYHQE